MSAQRPMYQVRFGADQWRNGNAGREPQEFEEWRSSHD